MCRQVKEVAAATEEEAAATEEKAAAGAPIVKKKSAYEKELDLVLIQLGTGNIGFVIPEEAVLIQRHDGAIETSGDGQIITEKWCTQWHTQVDTGVTAITVVAAS